MCMKNDNGRVPTCIEARYGGPGCEDHQLCDECRIEFVGSIETNQAMTPEERVDKVLALMSFPEREVAMRVLVDAICAAELARDRAWSEMLSGGHVWATLDSARLALGLRLRIAGIEALEWGAKLIHGTPGTEWHEEQFRAEIERRKGGMS